MNAKRFACLGIILLCCITVGAVGFAQKKADEGKKVTKEELGAVWNLQARSVCDQLNLSKDVSAKVTEAYLAAQASHRVSVKALPDEKDKDKARMAQQDLIEKDREQFMATLKGIVTADAATKIAATLGSFNSRWDGFAATLVNLHLGEATLKSAMGALIAYVSEYEQASTKSLQMFSRRPNYKPFKTKLDADLSGILSAEQAAQWKEATASSGGKDKGERKDEGSEKK